MSADRTVRHLRLRGPSESALHRARVTLEDAVRVASLPDRPGLVVVVRRLTLPAMRPGAPSQSWARALEEAVERSRRGWVHGSIPEAAAGEVVWFEDALEAHVHAAFGLTRGNPLDAWFWPLAVPALRDPRTRRHVRQGLRALALSLASRVEAPTALPRWVAVLVDTGARAELERALLPGDLPLLARAAGVAWREDPEPPAAATRRPSTPGERRGSEPRRRSAEGMPAASAVTAFLDVVAAKGRGHAPEPRVGVAPAPRRRGAPPADPGDGAAASGTPGRRGDGGPSPAPERGGRVPSTALRRTEAAPACDPVSNHPLPAPGPTQGRPTQAGGLLFLVAVLHGVGYPEWLARHPDWAPHDPARHVFASLLTRLDVPELDPAWSVARVQPPGADPVPSRFLAPARWRALCRPGPRRRHGRNGVAWACDASDRLLLAAWRRPVPGPGGAPPSPAADPPSMPRAWRTGTGRRARVADAWLTACRRWTRKSARLGLADLVRRPALLSATATHVDITLDLAHVDLRLRRVGLDLDPGWVWWLGRVVTFHYQPRPGS